MDLVKDTVRLEVTEAFLETFGTGTLVGTLSNKLGAKIPATVVLVFPQATLSWCQTHGGPHQWVVNEFTVRCLLEDVLQLREWGVDVQVETVTRDP